MREKAGRDYKGVEFRKAEVMRGSRVMYICKDVICKDVICDPICDFCWYCIHGENGEPVKCEKLKSEFDVTGYCDDFRCRLHESKL